MNIQRRNFFKWLGAGLASLPFLGILSAKETKKKCQKQANIHAVETVPKTYGLWLQNKFHIWRGKTTIWAGLKKIENPHTTPPYRIFINAKDPQYVAYATLLNEHNIIIVVCKRDNGHDISVDPVEVEWIALWKKEK